MRTKALIITAALGLASAASSMAQAVYSVNVVGYINVPVKNGYNLIANQLNASPNNSLTSVLGAALDDTQVLKFANNNYSVDLYYADLGGWITPEGAASTTTIKPGEGFFYLNPGSDRTITLVGEVQTGNSTVTSVEGYSLISSIVPQSLTLTPDNGFVPREEMQYLTFNAATQSYNTPSLYYVDLGGWITPEGAPSVPTPQVGQGFFILNPGPGAHAWTRSFNPNN